MTGVSIALFPLSWHLGPWRKKNKYLFALGPFRLVLHTKVVGTFGQISTTPNNES